MLCAVGVMFRMQYEPPTQNKNAKAPNRISLLSLIIRTAVEEKLLSLQITIFRMSPLASKYYLPYIANPIPMRNWVVSKLLEIQA